MSPFKNPLQKPLGEPVTQPMDDYEEDTDLLGSEPETLEETPSAPRMPTPPATGYIRPDRINAQQFTNPLLQKHFAPLAAAQRQEDQAAYRDQVSAERQQVLDARRAKAEQIKADRQQKKDQDAAARAALDSANAAKEATWRKEGRSFYADRATGELLPELPDAEWQKQREQQQATEAEKTRKNLIQREIDGIEAETNLTALDRKTLTNTDREKLQKELKTTTRDAVNSHLLPSLNGPADETDKAGWWDVVNNQPTEKAIKAKQRLEALNNRLIQADTDDSPVDLDDDDLADIEQLHPETAGKIRGTREALSADDSNKKWLEERTRTKLELELRRDNPVAWAQLQRQKITSIADPDVADNLASNLHSSLEARGQDWTSRRDALQQTQQSFAANREALAQQNADAISAGLAPHEIITLTDPATGKQEVWKRDLLDQVKTVETQAQQWDTENAPVIQSLQVEQQELDAEAKLTREAAEQATALRKQKTSEDRTKLKQNPSYAPFVDQYSELEKEGARRNEEIKSKFQPQTPEHDAAIAALQTELQTRNDEITSQLNQKRTAGAQVYDAWRKAPDDASRATVLEQVKDLGLTEPEAKYWISNFEKTDFSKGNKDDSTRVNLDGEIAVNPSLWTEPEKAQKAIEASDATPAAKKHAIAQLPNMEETAYANVIFSLAGKGQGLEDFAKKHGSDILVPGMYNMATFTPEDVEERLQGAEYKTPKELAKAFLADRGKGMGWVKTQLNQMLVGATTGTIGWGQQLAATVGAVTGNQSALDFSSKANATIGSLGSASALMPAGDWTAKLTSGATSMIPAMLGGIGAGIVGRVALAGRLGKMAPTAAAALAGRIGLAGSAGAAGIQSFGGTFGEAYDAYKAQGMSEEAAQSAAWKPALASGLSTAIITAVGGRHGVEAAVANEAAKGLITKQATSFVKALFKGATNEFAEEGIDQFVQGIIASASYQPDKSWHDIIMESLEAGTIGAVLGGAVEGVTSLGGQPAQQPAAVTPENFAAAQAQIDSHNNPEATPEQNAATKQAASTLVAIAQGKADTLTDAQLAVVDLKRNSKGLLENVPTQNNRPVRVKIENGNPIISQRTLDKLAEQFPAVRAVIGMDETQARQFYQTPPKSEPVPTSATAEAPIQQPSAQSSRDVSRELAPEEQTRIQELTDFLTEREVTPEHAAIFAEGHVRAEGITDNDYTIQAAKLVRQMTSFGGGVKARTTGNVRAVKAMQEWIQTGQNKAPAPSPTPAPTKAPTIKTAAVPQSSFTDVLNTPEWSEQRKKAIASITGKDPLKVGNRRKGAVKALATLDKQLTRYGPLFPGGVRLADEARPVDAQMVASSGGLWTDPSGGQPSLVLHLPTFVYHYGEHADDTRPIQSVVEEELIHRVTLSKFKPQELANFHSRLPASIQNEVWKGYNAIPIEDGDMPAEAPIDLDDLSRTNQAHEFLRMLVQDSAFRGRVSESLAVDTSLRAKVVEMLKNLAKSLRNLIRDAPAGIRSEIEGYEKQTIKALQELLNQAPESKPVEKAGNTVALSKDDLNAQGKTLGQTDTTTPEESPQPHPIVQKAVLGAEGTAYTDQNEAIQYRWAAVDVKELVVSNDDQGRINPQFPQVFQPRDRTSAGSEAQVNDIAKNANFDRLSKTNLVSDGAPIMADDAVVESGNGRIMGLRRAYNNSLPSIVEYRTQLLSKAGEFGLDPAKIEELKQPVLVRLRTTLLSMEQRVAFGQAANVSTVAPMREAETAKKDAKNLTADLLSTFTTDDNANLLSQENADFLRAFVRDIIPPAERAAAVDAQGNLSQSGLRRVRNALFVAAYGDGVAGMSALTRLAESTDDSGRNLIAALTAAAPVFAEQKARMEKNALHSNLDITQDIIGAVSRYNDLKAEGTSVSDFLAQDQIPGLGDDLAPVQRALLSFLDGNARSAKRLKEAFSRYQSAVEGAGDPQQGALFGDTVLEKADLWNLAAPQTPLAAGRRSFEPLAVDQAAKVYKRLFALQQRGIRLNDGQNALMERAERALGQQFFFEGQDLSRFSTYGTNNRVGFYPEGEPQGALLSSPKQTKYNPIQQQIADALQTRLNAFAVLKTTFDENLRTVASSLRDATPITAPLKGLPRAVEKLDQKRTDLIKSIQLGHPNVAELAKEAQPKALAAWLHDLLRGSIILDTIDQKDAALDHLRRIYGPDNLVITDRFANPAAGGYSDVQIKAQIKPGYWTEIQIHIPEMLAAKEGDNVRNMGVPERYWPANLNIEGLDPSSPGHVLYAEARSLSKNDRKVLGLNQQMARLYQAALAAYSARFASRSASNSSLVNSLTNPPSGQGALENSLSILPLGPRMNVDPASIDIRIPSSSKNLASGENGSNGSISGLLTSDNTTNPDTPQENTTDSANNPLGSSQRKSGSQLSLGLFDFLEPEERQAKLAQPLLFSETVLNEASRPTPQRASRPVPPSRSSPPPQTTTNLGELFRQAGVAGQPAADVQPAGQSGGSRSGGNQPASRDVPVESLFDTVREPRESTPQSVPRVPARVPVDSTNSIERPAKGSPARNFEPSSKVESLSPVTDKAKVEANLAAIDLLKKLESDRRNATPEEKEILAAYSGWGAFKEAFNDSNEQSLANHWDRLPSYSQFQKPPWLRSWQENWRPLHKQLKERLTDAEFRAASRSTLTSYFTGAPVIRSVWKMVERLGFTGGNALEPSAGAGHFIGLQPSKTADKTKWQAIELDELSARLLSKLYPETTVNESAGNTESREAIGLGFERARIPNGSLDLIISNVPFHESGPRKKGFPSLNLHNFFFVQGMAKVKPGGLVAFITSSSTMQNNPKQRQFIAGKGDLVAAMRLPNNAFRESAGTEVVTDILIFRKPDGTPFIAEAWQNLREVGRQVVTLTPSKEQTLEEFRREAATMGKVITEHERHGTKAIDVDAPIMVNEYFANHPEHVLGQHSLQGSMYRGNEYTVTTSPGFNVGEALDRLTTSLPKNVMGRQKVEVGPINMADRNDKPFSFVLRDDKPYEVQPDGRMESPDWATNPKSVRTWRSWLTVKDAVSSLIQAENKSTSTDKTLDSLRSTLNQAYDAHVANHGAISKRFGNQHTHLYGDPEFALTSALETEKQNTDTKSGKKTYTYEKADIFRQRIVSPILPPTTAQNVSDAIQHSLAWRGHVDSGYAAGLLNITPEEFAQQALGEASIFENPDTSMLETAESYLSGNIRSKLETAQAITKDDPKFEKNVKALRAAMPERRSVGSISPVLGARWIPSEVYNAFIKSILQGNDTVEYIPAGNMWSVRGTHLYRAEEYKTDRMGAHDILENVLSLKEPLIYDRTKTVNGTTTVLNAQATASAKAIAEKMKRAFIDFAKTSELQIKNSSGKNRPVWQVIEDSYNQTNNSYVTPTHKGDYLKFPGLNTDYVYTRPHRRAVIARFLSDRRGMMAHGVGSGKTFNQIILSHELRRLGLAKKPVIVVQNSTLGQFAASYLKAYPSAKVLVPTERDLETQNRRKLVSKIATGDWDAVILAHSQFDLISNKPEAIDNYLQGQIEELKGLILQEKRGERSKVRDLEGILKRLQDRRQSMLDSLKERQDTTIFWEDLGVDALIVDEAHNYKSIPIVTRMGRVKGVPSGADSQRAIGMLLKVRDVQSKTGNKNVFLATGTPVKNSMAEAYIMMDLIAPDVLADYKIYNFDDFATAFGQVVSSTEISWGGTPKVESRFAKFQNGRELITMIRTGFDVAMGNAALGLDVPAIKDGAPTITIVEPTPTINEFNAWVRNVANRWKRASSTDKQDNTAVPIMTLQAGIAAALDPRLVAPKAPDHLESKVNIAIGNVARIYKAGEARRTTQIIFADLRRPFNLENLEKFAGHPLPQYAGDKSDFDLYQDIKKKLVASGVKENEIALIEPALSKKQRTALFDKVDRGEIRIVVGSTETVGVGVNIQTRLKAVHHLMPPRDFTPAMMEQRNGRIVRQGNLHAATVDGQPAWNEEVEIIQYGTAGSMDSAVYGNLARKQRFITQLLMGEDVGDTFDDPTDPIAVNMAEMAARTMGDPDFIRRVELEKSIKELRLLSDAFTSELAGRRSRLARAERRIVSLPAQTEKLAAEAARLKDMWTRKAPRPEGVKEDTNIADKAVYEFGGKVIDTAAKDGGITIPLDVWLLDHALTMEKRGLKKANATLTLNGYPLTLEVHTVIGDNPASGHIVIDDDTTVSFNGAASLIQQLRRLPSETAALAAHSTEDLQSAKIQHKQLQALLSKQGGFEQAEELKALEKELEEVDARLTEKDQEIPESENEGNKPKPLAAAPKRSGRAQPLSALLRTPKGSRSFFAAKKGDVITAPDGTDQTIEEVHPQGHLPVFELSVGDRTEPFSEDHLFVVKLDSKDSPTMNMRLTEIASAMQQGRVVLLPTMA